MESRSPAYIAVLALIAGSILMIGWLMKPQPTEPEPQNPLLPPADMISPLTLLSQRGSLEDMAAYFSHLASDASPHLVFLEEPAQTGVVWDAEGTIITSNGVREFPKQVEATSGGGEVVFETSQPPPEAPVVALSPTSEFAPNPALHSRTPFLEHGEWLVTTWLTSPLERVFETPQPPPETPVVALSPTSEFAPNPALHSRTPFLEHGEWLVITWLTSPLERSFAPGLYLGSRPVECGRRPAREVSLSVTPSAEMAGGGVFDFDGSLIGLIANCDGRYLALDPQSVNETLDWSESFEGRTLAQYGLRIGLLSEDEREHFGGEETVLVREVWMGRLAEQAGLQPGDLIATFDGRPVTTPDDLHPLVLPAAREILELRVRRGRRMATATLPATTDVEVATDTRTSTGLVLASEPGGFAVESVVADSAAARAGMQSGDSLVTVDGSSVSSAARARRVLEGRDGKGHFVVVERGSRRWGALLTP
jgi:hypothetical protein